MPNRTSVPRSTRTARVRSFPGIFAAAAVLLVVTWMSGCSREPALSEAEVTEQAAEAAAAPVTVTVTPVTARPVRRKISVVGTLHGFEKISVTPKVEGRIEVVHYEVGDRIPAGATLLELDDTDYQLAADEAQRALEQELAKLGLSEPPVGTFDLQSLPSVEQARLTLQNATRRFERQRTLVSGNAASREVFEQAETDVKLAEAALRQAELEARTTLAAVRYRQSVLAVARQRQADTQVIAPPFSKSATEGGEGMQYAVSDRMASVGEMVRAFPSTPVYELVADDVLKLKVMVPERYLGDVAIGLEAEVRVDAYPGEVFPARVVRINPTVNPQSRTFEVEGHVPNFEHRLRDGGFAKAEIIAAEDSQALTVPLEAITRFAGVSKVFRIRDDVAEELVVETADQGEGWVEVKGALRSGDRIVTSGQSQLANGTKVVIRDIVAHTASRR